MTPERWRRIETLYDAALHLPEGEQERFLDEHCAGDTVLRGELVAMFRHSGGEEILQAIVANAAAETPDSNAWEGRRLGPWKIVRPIGEGGMGTVFLAVRDDGQYTKAAAIKTLRFEACGSTALNRLRQERQVLANLEHPNIARLLDGGTFQDGLPFIVMEYVPGVEITEFCRTRSLDIPARIRLFQLACEAVQYAHQQLVIHRDIKPANILVTPDGIPKLLDFGIAKLLDSVEGETSATKTVTGLTPMTLGYSSPEQVRGEPASTVTDVYQLGAVLYELLTGERAQRVKTTDPVESARVICQMEVALPSSIAGRACKGDLDTIVLKAMKKEPSRRYQSVMQFSEDLSRYLAGRPVIARPDSFGYRTGKYLRRNWLGATAIAAVAISLAAGAGVALYQARVATQRFGQVRRLANRFLFDFDDRIRDLPGATAAREMLVATALEYLDSLSRDSRSDPSLQWELAKAYEKVGAAQGSPAEPSLGRIQDAMKAYTKSLAMQEDLYHRGLLTAAQRESLVETWLDLSAIYRTAGTGSQAIDAARRGADYARGIPSAELKASAVLAEAHLWAGHPQETLAIIQPMLAGLEARFHGSTEWSVESHRLAVLYQHLGRAQARLARFEDAAITYRKLIALREPRLSAPLLDVLNGRELVLAYQGAGDVLGATDRFSLGLPRQAEPFFRKALALAERLAAADRDNAPIWMEVARSAGKLGSVLETAQPAEAMALYRRAREIAERFLPDGPNRQSMEAAANTSLALPLAYMGRTAEARKMLDGVLALIEPQYAKQPDSLSITNDLADTWVTLGLVEQRTAPTAAANCYRRSLDFAEKAAVVAPRDFSVAFRLHRALNGLAESLGDGDEARLLRTRIVELWTQWDGLCPGSPFIQKQLRDAKSRRSDT